MNHFFLLLILLFFSFNPAIEGNFWSQFRGAHGDGVLNVENMPLNWGNDENILWKTKLPGKGWSSPIIWGDKVFITTAYQQIDRYFSLSFLKGNLPHLILSLFIIFSFSVIEIILFTAIFE